MIASAKIQDNCSSAIFARTLKIVDQAASLEIENTSLLLQQESTDMVPHDGGINFFPCFALSGTPCPSFPKRSQNDNNVLGNIIAEEFENCGLCGNV